MTIEQPQQDRPRANDIPEAVLELLNNDEETTLAKIQAVENVVTGLPYGFVDVLYAYADAERQPYQVSVSEDCEELIREFGTEAPNLNIQPDEILQTVNVTSVGDVLQSAIRINREVDDKDALYEQIELLVSNASAAGIDVELTEIQEAISEWEVRGDVDLNELSIDTSGTQTDRNEPDETAEVSSTNGLTRDTAGEEKSATDSDDPDWSLDVSGVESEESAPQPEHENGEGNTDSSDVIAELNQELVESEEPPRENDGNIPTQEADARREQSHHDTAEQSSQNEPSEDVPDSVEVFTGGSLTHSLSSIINRADSREQIDVSRSETTAYHPHLLQSGGEETEPRHDTQESVSDTSPEPESTESTSEPIADASSSFNSNPRADVGRSDSDSGIEDSRNTTEHQAVEMIDSAPSPEHTIEGDLPRDNDTGGVVSQSNRTQDLVDFDYVMDSSNEALPDNIDSAGMIKVSDDTYATIAKITPRNWSFLSGEKKAQVANIFESKFLRALEFPIDIILYETELDIDEHKNHIQSVIESKRDDPDEPPLIKAARAAYPGWLDTFIDVNDMRGRDFYLVIEIDPEQILQYQDDPSLVQTVAGKLADVPVVGGLMNSYREDSAEEVTEAQLLRELEARMQSVKTSLAAADVDLERIRDKQTVLSVYYQHQNYTKPIHWESGGGTSDDATAMGVNMRGLDLNTNSGSGPAPTDAGVDTARGD